MTSKDIARLAGVSQSTVSRVLTNDPRVRAETRKRVLRVLREVKYAPNLAARAMKTGRTGVVGVVTSRITNPFHSQLLHALGAELARAGLQMIFWDAERGADDIVVQAIRQGHVDGVIFTTASAESLPLAAALDQGLPVVLIHWTVERLHCDQVTGDNWEGGRAVARYLIHHGHRRIGLISGPLVGSTTREREMGFRAGLSEAGIDLDPHLCLRRDFSHNAGYRAARQLLEGSAPPTAIFAANDILAFGACDAARAAGVRVPDELWVIGYDNTDMASWAAFDLTTVEQPITEIVEKGVELLRRRTTDRNRDPELVRLPCRLVIRGSTAGAHAPDEWPARRR